MYKTGWGKWEHANKLREREREGPTITAGTRAASGAYFKHQEIKVN